MKTKPTLNLAYRGAGRWSVSFTASNGLTFKGPVAVAAQGKDAERPLIFAALREAAKSFVDSLPEAEATLEASAAKKKR
ncbi:hypothetical protein [Bosea rubneri]|uniref:Uncharacterized protein n=1 Tax=Bosea rubneri TaxID=3075434 RepID=A0ABU3SGP6_9HYPH|nr:hypothetical protein [Bosea sp. ZW T0_25]MDU0343964.1 hypothetical protein [Bosea sp. ZW T0_25]